MICSNNTTCSIRQALLAALALGSAVMANGGDTVIDDARHAADAAMARNDPVLAEATVRKAMVQTHADDALRAWLAKALLAQGNRDGARHVLDTGGLTPDSAALGWRLRGQIALADGNLRGAAADFDQALRIAPGDADLWVAIAGMRYSAGEQALSEAAADHAVALDPANPRALALRGMLVREQYGLAASLPWFEAALKLHPDDPALLDAYGSTLGDMGQYRAMLIVARKLADVDPKSPRPRLMEAVLAARAGQTELARAILQRTGPTFRDTPAVLLLSGVLEYRAGNTDTSVHAFERLVSAQPDNAVARHLLARALATKGDWRRLVDLFDGDVAAGRAGPDTITLVGQGWAHLARRENAERGKADLDRAHTVLAQAAAMAGNAPGAALGSDGAPSVLAVAYSENPHAAATAVPLIRALLSAHQADPAQPVADQLRDANAGNADAQLVAGDVRMMRGDTRGALVDYGHAAAIRFNEAVLVRMDSALRATGQSGQADAMTSRYLAQNPESATAMTLLAAGWAQNPARAAALAALRQVMLARGAEWPLTHPLSTAGHKPG